MNMQRKFGWAGVLALAALLGACSSGSDDSGPPITQEVPATAGNSPEDFIAAVRAIVEADADLLEPSDISAVSTASATTETQEPVGL